MKKNLFIYSGIAAAVLLIFIIGVLVYLGGEGGDKNNTTAERITVPKGASTWKVARLLKSSGIINSERRFVWHVKWNKLDGQLKAGTYEIKHSESMREISSRIVRADELEIAVTFPEGLTAKHVASILQENEICDSSEFIKTITDKSFIKTLGLDVPTIEGFLFPETYNFRLHVPPEKVAADMYNLFREKVGDEWWAEAEKDELGLFGVVILASIVAGEYQLDDEAAVIAGLYRNRIRGNWKLQACPTVQYLLPDAPRRLLYEDLRIDSPYNTYKYKGLPPGPINNPGLKALNAALHPAKVPWMFMVARGDGGHVFSKTLDGHAKAKAEYDRKFRRAGKTPPVGSGG